MEHMHNHADNLCKQARVLPDQNKYCNLLANKVNLVLNEKVITAHAPKAMAKAYHSINIRNYYRDKHHWVGATVSSIWWKAYGNEGPEVHQRLDANQQETK
jgi:hypothetical protein